MRILHLIPSFEIGGAERQLSLLAPALAASGVECHIAYGRDGPNLAALAESGVVLHKLSVRSNHHPMILSDLASLLRRVRPDIVQTWLLQMDVVGGFGAHLFGIPHILSERASSEAYQGGWKDALRIIAGRHASAIVANSRYGSEYWRSQMRRKAIHVVPNCVAPLTEAPVDGPICYPEGKFILFAGRLCEQKNVLTLISALNRALTVMPEYTAVMFGEGPLEADAKASIAALGMDGRIAVCGFTRNLPGWIDHADMIVSVSHFEGQPNFVLEAASQRCPIILSDIPTHREFLGADEAWYVDPDSAVSIANGIICAAKDAAGREAKASKASIAVSEYSVGRCTERYLSI